MAPIVHWMMDVHGSTVNFNQERVMSQSAHEKQNPRNVPTSQHPALVEPILDVSPDDPVGVDPDGTTGKPAQIEK